MKQTIENPFELRKSHFETIEPTEQFKYPYILYNPYDKPRDLLIWGTGSLKTNEEGKPDVTFLFENNINENLFEQCYNRNIAVAILLLPRVQTEYFTYDSQIMHRHTMGFSEEAAEQPDQFSYFVRPDLEVLKIIKDAQNKTNTSGKVIIGGMSTGANFANRFSVLHPDIIKGTICMSAGDYMLPIDRYNDTPLIYPFGTHDIDTTDLVAQIPHFVYVGEQDVTLEKDPLDHDLSGTGLAKSYRKLLGQNQYERTLTFANCVKKIFSDFTFYTRPDLGHGTDYKVYKKVFEFVDSLLDN